MSIGVELLMKRLERKAIASIPAENHQSNMSSVWTDTLRTPGCIPRLQQNWCVSRLCPFCHERLQEYQCIYWVHLSGYVSYNLPHLKNMCWRKKHNKSTWTVEILESTRLSNTHTYQHKIIYSMYMTL